MGPVIAEAWPTMAPGAAGSVTENSTYWWHLSGDISRPFDATLRVNGIGLVRDIVSPGEIWFQWQLGFNAGFADIEVLGIDMASKSMRLVVDPEQLKLVRKDFRLMLRDIMNDTRSLASTAGLRQGLARGKHELPIAKLEYILESTPRLAALARDLDACHRKRLHKAISHVPLRNARGITSLEWSRSRRFGQPISEEQRSKLPESVSRIMNSSGGLLPRRVEQPRTVQQSGRREHAEILGLVRSALAELRRAAKMLVTNGTGPADAVLVNRCRSSVRTLTDLLDLGVFSGLEPLNGAWRHSHLYLRVEPYRSLYILYKDLRSGFGSVDGDFGKIPLRETFRLYETWVALRLAKAASLIDPDIDATSIFSDALDANMLTYSLRSTSLQFQGSILRFKPIYNEVWRSDDGVGSYSRQMIPDIVLEVQESPLLPKRVLILDTKYRIESELNDAIASIHMYKDALVEMDQSSSAGSERRIVGSGFVVVPSMPRAMKPTGDWLQEKMPTVIFRQGYQDRFRLGAIVLRPGMDAASFAETLVKLVGERAETALRDPVGQPSAG